MWTNAALRKALGEHGYFEVRDSIIEVIPDNPNERKSFRTAWTRADKLVYLITSDSAEPRVEDSSGNVVDVNVEGYRDPKAPEAWKVT